MEVKDIVSLWESGMPAWQDVSVRMILEGMPETFSTAVVLIDRSAEEKSASLIKALRGKYVFLRAGYDVSDGLTVGQSEVFGNLQEDYNSIVSQLNLLDERQLGKVYKFFEGLRPDLETLYPQIDFSRSLRPEEMSTCTTAGHQLMVFVTGVCNLDCSYCFSSDIDRKYISLPDLRRIFDWASREGCPVVTPCGGEPLVYPYIKEFMDLVREKKMTTYFASNCTVPLTIFNDSQLESIDLITFHLTAALWSNAEYMRIFCDNIELAQKKGIEIIARANIYKKDMDVDRWFAILDKYNIRRFNIALTIPSGHHDNEFVDIRWFSDYVELIKEIISKCTERGIELSFAKPIPPCVFDSMTACEILKYTGFQPYCNISEDGYTRNVALSPSMTLTPCLGMPAPEIQFSEELSWEDLSICHGGKVKEMLHKPLLPKCVDCFLFKRRICQGACLSYKMGNRL